MASDCPPHHYVIAGHYTDDKGRKIVMWMCDKAGCNDGYERQEM